jgi:hypothetical protein
LLPTTIFEYDYSAIYGDVDTDLTNIDKLKNISLQLGN